MSDAFTSTRREFVKVAGTAAVGASLFPLDALAQASAKRRYAIVGTGDRGSGMWGRDLAKRYPDLLEFVGLCDINPKRAAVARDFIGATSCPTFSNFDEMIDKAKPDLLMVTTVDGFHHEYIIKGLDRGIDVMTEKPLTTDETKCQAILDAEKRNNRTIVVTFNYDMTKSQRRMDLYATCEDVDGYYRDGCVFREDVDIFDNMQAIVKYTNGATMSYALNAYLPYEGYRVAFNGEKGRLDVQSFERQPWEVADSHEIFITKSFGKRTKVPIPTITEGHGGSDDRMRDPIFRKTDAPEYMKLPDSRAGAMSCLTGIAIRNSIDQKKPIRIADLVRI